MLTPLVILFILVFARQILNSIVVLGALVYLFWPLVLFFGGMAALAAAILSC